METCKSLCVSPSTSHVGEVFLAVTRPKTASEVLYACEVATSDGVVPNGSCNHSETSVFDWWYVPLSKRINSLLFLKGHRSLTRSADRKDYQLPTFSSLGVLTVVGIGASAVVGAVRYLNRRRHPRWIHVCRIIDAIFKVLHFGFQCVWKCGLVSAVFTTQSPPLSVKAAGNPPNDDDEYFTASDDGNNDDEEKDGEEEYEEEEDDDEEDDEGEDDNEGEAVAQGFEYPMTDDED